MLSSVRGSSVSAGQPASASFAEVRKIDRKEGNRRREESIRVIWPSIVRGPQRDSNPKIAVPSQQGAWLVALNSRDPPGRPRNPEIQLLRRAFVDFKPANVGLGRQIFGTVVQASWRRIRQ